MTVSFSYFKFFDWCEFAIVTPWADGMNHASTIEEWMNHASNEEWMNEYRINQSINQTIHKHTLIAKEQKQVSHRGWRAKHFKGLLTIQNVPPACRTPPGTVRCNAKVILGMAINRTRIRLCGSSILRSHAIDSHRVYSFETQKKSWQDGSNIFEKSRVSRVNS